MESGLDWTNRDLMKWLFGQPTRGCWRLLKPFRVTLIGLAASKGESHGLIPAAKVEVSLGLALENGPGPAPGAALETMLEPTVKAALMVTYRVCTPSPQTNLHLGGESASMTLRMRRSP